MQKRKETVYSKSNQINEEIHIDVRKVTQSKNTSWICMIHYQLPFEFLSEPLGASKLKQ